MKICKSCKIEKELSDFYKRIDINNYRSDCKDCHNKKAKKRRSEPDFKYNLERNREYDREYYKKISKKESYKESRKIRARKAYKSLPELTKLRHRVKSNIQYTFKIKGYKKSKKTEEILGCSILEFQIHLESKFETWMNWENRGLYNGYFNYGWDIDHIIPVSTAQTEEDVIRLNHYSNLQPLCSKINRDIKRDSLS
jgi:hypothetical protein